MHDTNEKIISPEHQFVAILFADIEGYTSLMQKDETQAVVLLRQFQFQLKTKVPLHQGRVINFYGDGALCVFTKSIDAMRCAMELQIIFDQTDDKEIPNVPVRIGIHFGRVTFEDNYAFGHSINVTSRIESMGTVGAILFSQQVKQDIYEHLDLQMISLDSFEFKNVEEPIEVFALANKGFKLPKRTELKGKFKVEKKANPTTEKSIAVLAFENRSGDPQDDFFSEGISEDVIYALSKIKQIHVMGRVSSFSFKGKNVDSIEIGQKLKVQNLLIGRSTKIQLLD